MNARSSESAIAGKSSARTRSERAFAVAAPHIRNVRPEDLEEVWRVHVAASNDLMVRRGRPAARPPVGSGFRIGDPTLFMASRLFGRPELYLPSGPILY